MQQTETSQQIEGAFTDLLAGLFRIKPEDVRPGVTVGELSFDSLTLIELGLALEERFGVEVPDGTLTPDMTVGQVVSLLDEKKAEV